jgi:hypothetical protein
MERDQLTKLQDTGLPVAVPLGADLHAVHTDVPALLVSRLPGRLTYPREPTAAFISALAQAAAVVHGQPVPDQVWPWHDRGGQTAAVRRGWPESSTGETPALDTPHSRSPTWRPT